MVFTGIRRVFSTVGDRQYETIGQFWDELSARYGISNLMGLGCGWTETTIDYVMALKEGIIDGADCTVTLPDEWDEVCGKTEDLAAIYGEIYRSGPLQYEIEEFDESGNCRIRYCRFMTVNGAEYRITRLLGKGKGGYSYLAQRDGRQYVLKQIHHEPCDYYQFGNKLESELRDYARLLEIGIPMPRMIEVDHAQERILKEYIPGDTVMDQVKRGEDVAAFIPQVEQMCACLYPAGLNIDYYPTNFIAWDGRLYYIDYECNSYSDQWNFENWGRQYWS